MGNLNVFWHGKTLMQRICSCKSYLHSQFWRGVVSALLRNGANPFIADRPYNIPQISARFLGDDAMAQLLNKHQRIELTRSEPSRVCNDLRAWSFLSSVIVAPENHDSGATIVHLLLLPDEILILIFRQLFSCT